MHRSWWGKNPNCLLQKTRISAGFLRLVVRQHSGPIIALYIPTAIWETKLLKELEFISVATCFLPNLSTRTEMTRGEWRSTPSLSLSSPLF